MKTRIGLSPSSQLVWSLGVSLAALFGLRPAMAQDANAFPTVTITATDATAGESGPDTGTFTVKRTGLTNVPLAVFYTLGGTAFNGVDYEPLGNSVQIPAGALEASFVVKPIDDLLVEGDESVVAQLAGSPLACATCGYNIGLPNQAALLILDNDKAGTNQVQAVVNLYAIDDTGSEIPVVPPWLDMVQRSDPVAFLVTRTGPTDLPLTVFYRVGGTASNGVDYLYGAAAADQGLPGSVTIPAGASSVNLDVWVIDDFEVEGTETVELTLEPPVCIDIFPPPPGCYLVGPTNRAVASILDNDLTPPPVVTIAASDPDAAESGPDPGRFTVSRTGDTAAPLGVFYTVSGTAKEGLDYLALSDPTPFFTIFTGFNYLEIPAGSHSADIVVTPIDDALAEGGETVVVQLRPQVWWPYVVGAPSNAVVTIADNDMAGTDKPVVSIVARDPFASEGSKFWLGNPETDPSTLDFWNLWHVNIGGTNTATFVVRRHGPATAELTVNYEVGGTASGGTDYVALPGSVTIPAGNHSARIVVTPIDDAVPEGIETVLLKLRTSPDYAVGFPAQAAAILIDNDQPRPRCARLRDGLFHLCRPATNGFCFRVEASVDLRHWNAVCTNVVTDGALHFVDPDAPPLNARFYRVQPEQGLGLDD